MFAVYEELSKDEPEAPVHHRHRGRRDQPAPCPRSKTCPNTAAAGTIECKFWGLGGDGTVGANKNSIKIIGDHTDKYVQAYFQYDSKKTGGVTISHLRFGDKPIRSPYYINKADFVACHNPSYIDQGLPDGPRRQARRRVHDQLPVGLTRSWTTTCPPRPSATSPSNNIQLYTINAIDLAIEIGMGKRTNTILQSAFFSLAKVMPEEEAIQLHEGRRPPHSYLKKGQDVVDMNHKAIDARRHRLQEGRRARRLGRRRGRAKDRAAARARRQLVKMVKEILEPVGTHGRRQPARLRLRATMWTAPFELGAAAYEKRGVAVTVPDLGCRPSASSATSAPMSAPTPPSVPMP